MSNNYTTHMISIRGDDYSEDSSSDYSESEISPDICIFVNTIGIRCPNYKYPGLLCCKEHMCTYIKNNRRCERVMDCHSKWYCNRHYAPCRCNYLGDNGLCTNTIYYFEHKAGYVYCNKHRCLGDNCMSKALPNLKFQLCSIHYNALIFCKFIDEKGIRCGELADQLDHSPELLSSGSPFAIRNRNIMRYHMYCHKHTCTFPKCNNKIIQDGVSLCNDHAFRCNFMIDLSHQCPDFILINSGCPRCTVGRQKCTIYCEKHACHWIGGLNDYDSCCHSPIAVDGSERFCKKHLLIHNFHKFEFQML